MKIWNIKKDFGSTFEKEVIIFWSFTKVPIKGSKMFFFLNQGSVSGKRCKNFLPFLGTGTLTKGHELSSSQQ
jgi:hypothetical protein